MSPGLTPGQRDALARLLEEEIRAVARQTGAGAAAFTRAVSRLRHPDVSPPVGDDGEHSGDDPLDDPRIGQ
jgi:hypothetical protein